MTVCFREIFSNVDAGRWVEHLPSERETVEAASQVDNIVIFQYAPLEGTAL